MRRVIEHRICKRCGKDKTLIDSKGYAHWSRAEGGGFYCHACYYIINGYTKRKWDRQNARKNKLRIAFLGKRVILTFNPRKGICVKCGRKGFTHMNHLMYIPIMPWACTEESCPRCHGDYSYNDGVLVVGKNSISFFATGEKNPQWRGGVGQTNQRWRKVVNYDKWREAVLQKDGYRCVDCGCTDIKLLEVHHIKKADEYPELRYDVGNGITNCRLCHNEKRKKKKE